MDLQYLKRYTLLGETPAFLFFQLKEIFHLLESLASARIEGNRTTVAELVDEQVAPSGTKSEALMEIRNMQEAMSLIDKTVQPSGGITKSLILELHSLVVSNLTVEGDEHPGAFRSENVRISGSAHVPIDYVHVESYFDELLAFINSPTSGKYDLLKTALAHHRFAWIHPFKNGNGRVVRLITYAMLIERGFRGVHLKEGRILNPSAVFCSNREGYYEMLSVADGGTKEGLLAWCEFVLDGLKNELSKIDKLLDYKYLSENILTPGIDFCRERKLVTQKEHEVLVIAVKQQKFKSGDLEKLVSKASDKRSRFIARMKEHGLISALDPGGRTYTLQLAGQRNPLLRGIIYALEKEGFVNL